MIRMIRVWLNHWFSTAYNIVQLLKEGKSDLLVVGSHPDQHSPIEAVCDEWHCEPHLKGDEYAQYCFEFCLTHAIDVFIPRYELVSISRRKEDFERAGIKVMVDDFTTVSMLNDKAKAYELLGGLGIDNIPDYETACNIGSFENAYIKLSKEYENICVKFASDVGGKSYRLIDNAIDAYGALFKKSTTRISYQDLLRALEKRDEFPKMMVMPYLPGEEVSIDCLTTHTGTIAVSRTKTTSRIEKVEFTGDLIEECNRILERVPLENPCNIQYKFLDGKPYLLEINTRMSGGIHMSCAASGINIPLIALYKLLSIDTTWEMSMRSNLVTQVEIPIIISDPKTGRCAS